jgi:hypothetical protein
MTVLVRVRGWDPLDDGVGDLAVGFALPVLQRGERARLV